MEAKDKDYLSSLPDEILHHIFSFLGDNHIVRLQGVSRRFQTICFTSPSLSIYNHPPGSNRFRFSSRNCSCKSVFNFMNSLLQHRPHALKINKLSFSSFCKRSRHRKLHKHWIEKLFQDFLVEDELSVHHRDVQYVFKMFPRFQSLKVLKISFSKRRLVKLPKIQLASIETLHMRLVLTNDPVDKWVSQSFPSLKRLSLMNVVMDEGFMKAKQPVLTIRNSSLEHLVIYRCCRYKTVRVITENLRSLSYTICFYMLCCHGVFDYEHSLEISAPLLQSLTLEGFPERFHCKGTFKNLHLVTLTHLIHSDLSDRQNAFIQLNKALKWATILHTDVRMLEGLFRIRETPISFESIRHVQIQLKAVGMDYVMSDIASNFMDRLPNLETLTIVHMFNEDVVRECRRVAGERVIKGLKKVEFMITYMDDSMALLIGLFKKWCVDLKEMVLNYPPHQHQSMLRYLESFDMASNLYAPLSIHFLPDY